MQTPTPNAEFTRRLYNVNAARPQRAHGALDDPTALQQLCHSVLSNTLRKRQAAAFVLSLLKINTAAWRSRRLHSVSTALMAFSQRVPRRSAFFKTVLSSGYILILLSIVYILASLIESSQIVAHAQCEVLTQIGRHFVHRKTNCKLLLL